MQKLLLWQRLYQNHSLFRGLDLTLRGYSQVMLQNNPLCGLFFFIAIFISSLQAGMPQIAWGGLLGTITATATAALLLTDRHGLAEGLYGYNGCLTGIALPVFLTPEPLMWVTIIFWSMLLVPLTVSITRCLAIWRIPVLTAPFVLASWIVLLASYHFTALKAAHLPSPTLPLAWLSSSLPLSGTGELFSALLAGVSQVFLANSALAGGLILLGLACSSLRAMSYGLSGSALALGISVLLKAEHQPLDQGLYAFSSVLTAIALGCTFQVSGWRTLLYSLAGVVSTVLVQGAFNTLLAPLGIPSLTIPFMVVTWSYLLALPAIA